MKPEKIYKIDKPLSSLTQKKRKTKIIGMRNERRDVTADSTVIKRFKSQYY